MKYYSRDCIIEEPSKNTKIDPHTELTVAMVENDTT